MFDDTRGDGGGGDGGGWFGSWHSRPRHYVLIGHRPMPCDDILKWAAWFEFANRRVAATKVRGLFVSTVFLGIDSALYGEPILFETMTFRGGKGGPRTQSCRWGEALRLHKSAVRSARQVQSARELARWNFNIRDFALDVYGLRESVDPFIDDDLYPDVD
jgi:hypothetical protein